MAGGMLRTIAAALFLVAAFSPAPAQDAAANYPGGTVVVVVPYPPGGPPDVIARILTPALQTILGRPVIVENRAGASGALGASSVARAAPDGLTLLLIDPSLTVAQNINAKPGFDPQKDFAWVAPLMRSYMTLVVHPSVPARTAPEFVALAKQKPGALQYGTSGIGSPPYLGALAFIQATGIDLLHVPYRGAALALNEAAGGHIASVFVSQATAGAQVKGGALRLLGVYGEDRLRAFPDTPTFKESGIDTPVANQGTWFGIAAPSATPRAIVMKLNGAVNEALRDPKTRSLLETADFVKINGGAPEELGALVDSNAVYWRESFAKAGIKAE